MKNSTISQTTNGETIVFAHCVACNGEKSRFVKGQLRKDC